MNDHEAMEAVNAVLEQFYRGQLDSYQALTQIARVSGENTIDHQESK